MRTLGFRTHVLLSIAAAAGLVLTLARPWYAAAPKPVPEGTAGIGDINGPLNGLADGAQRWVTGTDGVSGWDSLGPWATGLAALAGIASLGALACLVPVLQSLGRDLVRYAALAALAVTAWKLLDPPGPNDTRELRNGALAAAGAVLMMLTCGIGAAGAPVRRRVAPKPFEAPPPPPAFSTSGSAPPPGG